MKVEKYSFNDLSDMTAIAASAMQGILATYQAVDGKLDLPPPDMMANTCFEYAKAIIAKRNEVAKEEMEWDLQDEETVQLELNLKPEGEI